MVDYQQGNRILGSHLLESAEHLIILCKLIRVFRLRTENHSERVKNNQLNSWMFSKRLFQHFDQAIIHSRNFGQVHKALGNIFAPIYLFDTLFQLRIAIFQVEIQHVRLGSSPAPKCLTF